MIPVFQNHAAASAHQDAIRELMIKAAQRDGQAPLPERTYPAHKPRRPDSAASKIMQTLKPGVEYTYREVQVVTGIYGNAASAALKDLRSKGIIKARVLRQRNMAYTLVGTDH
jgi:hypothetical protein